MKIKGRNIEMVRGDTEHMQVKFTDSETGEPYLLVDGDVIKFSIKKLVNDVTYILQKTITVFDENLAIIKIEPDDTKTLDYGCYFYDIQITFKNGDVKTIVQKSQFWITEEIS